MGHCTRGRNQIQAAPKSSFNTELRNVDWKTDLKNLQTVILY